MGSNDGAADYSRSFPDIFVSHSSKDRAIVEAIVSGLKAAGFSTYCSSLDQRSSTRGYDIDLDEKINGCPLVLGLQSNNALASAWVHAEWAEAWEQDKLLFARIESIKGRIHFVYKRLHYEDLSQWNGSAQSDEWKRLIEALTADLEAKKRMPRAEATDSQQTAPAGSIGSPFQPADVSLPDAPRFPALMPDFSNVAASAAIADAAESPSAKVDRPALPEDALPGLASPLELGLDALDWNLKNSDQLVCKALERNDFSVIHDAARSGQGDAQAIAGLAHLVGLAEVAPDADAAGRWLEKASGNGVARAKAELAVLIASGRFGDVDVARIDLLLAEAAAECVRAKTLRALLRWSGTRLPSVPYANVPRLLEEVHVQGDLLATTQLGWGLLQGLGMRRNSRRGFELLQHAAQAGDARAMAYLGNAYLFGRGARRDFDKAAHWFARSAARNDLLGQFYLAWCNEHGAGLARDAAEARKLYRIAADRGDNTAKVRLGRMMMDGRGGPADLSAAAQLMESVNDEGEDNNEAIVLLAQLLEEGRGVARDLSRAISLYEQAAKEGQPMALWRLGQLYEAGRGVGRDREHAITLYRRAALNASDRLFFVMVLKRLEMMGSPLRRDPE